MLLNIQELNLYGFRNGVLRLVVGKYKTICRLCRLTAVVSQIRCNNGFMNRWTVIPNSSRLSHRVSKIPSSLWKSRHRARSSGLKYSVEQITELLDGYHFAWIEPSLCTCLLFRTSLHKTYGIKRSTSCKFVVLLHHTIAHLASIFFEQLFQPFPQKQVNMRISESSCSRFDVTSGPRPILR